MSASTGYKYTWEVCKAFQDVLASLQIANKADSVTSRGDHEKARVIVLENRY
mgnify:CR=1 FL=1